MKERSTRRNLPIVQVGLKPATKAELEAFAEAHDWTPSQAGRKLIEYALERYGREAP